MEHAAARPSESGSSDVLKTDVAEPRVYHLRAAACDGS